MAYTNSPMVVYTKLSPNHSGQRTHSIDRITPHCVVGQCSVETLGSIFAPSSRQASSNYGIGEDGRVGMYVEEKNRSWCSSSSANDQRAVTIECASDNTEPYAFKDVVYQTLIKLCVDICQRNGKKKLLWLGDKDTTLAYTPKADEMVLTVHRWFANKSCPGSWMYARIGDLASKVTAQLGSSKQEETPTVTDAEKTIWDFLHGKIGNAYGAAGMMGNLYCSRWRLLHQLRERLRRIWPRAVDLLVPEAGTAGVRAGRRKVYRGSADAARFSVEGAAGIHLCPEYPENRDYGKGRL